MLSETHFFVIPPPDTGLMRSPQLALIETTASVPASRFRLDDRTRTIGLAGLAAARAALAEVAARRQALEDGAENRQAA